MPFKFNFSTLLVLVFLSFVTATSPVQAKDYSFETQLYKLAPAPVTAQFFDFGEESSDGNMPPPQTTQEQETGGIQNVIKGSLLGKLLFNMPFEKASLLDILALLAITFMISKFISRANLKKSSGNFNDNNTNSHSSSGQTTGPAAPPAGFDPWRRLRSGKPAPKKGKTIPFPGTEEQPAGHTRSEEEFYTNTQPDAEHKDDDFLKGAKMLYVRLHEAWKNQNLDFIQHFSSPEVFNFFKTKSQGPDKDEFIDIAKVDAKVLKDELRNGERYRVVEFTALVHKSKQAGPPSETKETWGFLEPSHTGTWRLEEIL